jgi:hypothetical protein
MNRKSRRRIAKSRAIARALKKAGIAPLAPREKKAARVHQVAPGTFNKKDSHKPTEATLALARKLALKYRMPLADAIKIVQGRVRNKRGLSRGPLFGNQHARRYVNG